MPLADTQKKWHDKLIGYQGKTVGEALDALGFGIPSPPTCEDCVLKACNDVNWWASYPLTKSFLGNGSSPPLAPDQLTEDNYIARIKGAYQAYLDIRPVDWCRIANELESDH